MTSAQPIAVAKAFLSLAALSYASWSDYKTREVSNMVWLFYAPVALALNLAEIFVFGFDLLLLYGLCFGLTSAFAIILFYTGAFGGADAKAFMCLALALPFYPKALFIPISGKFSPIMQLFFPLTVFSNSVLLAALMAVYILLHNLLWRWRTRKPLFEDMLRNEPIGKKLLVLLTSYKTPISRLKERWHIYPMEDIETVDNKPVRRLLVFPRDEGRDAIVERLSRAVEAGVIPENVWATPGLPMLVFVTMGLMIALLYGDLIWTLVCFMLGG
jgi:preflagellin peptidase FlaK